MSQQSDVLVKRIFGECLSGGLTFGMAARFAENLEEVVRKEELEDKYAQEMKEVVILHNRDKEDKIRQNGEYYKLAKARNLQDPDDYVNSRLLALSRTFEKNEDDISSKLIRRVSNEFQTAGVEYRKPILLRKAVSLITDSSENHKSAMSAFKAAKENESLCKAHCTVFGIKQQDREIKMSPTG